MDRIRWFQRLMFTLLVGVNAFVFMSMREVSLRENVLYTLALVAVTAAILSVLAYLNRIRRKKSSSHPA
jgi:hypothetical protein